MLLRMRTITLSVIALLISASLIYVSTSFRENQEIGQDNFKIPTPLRTPSPRIPTPYPETKPFTARDIIDGVNDIREERGLNRLNENEALNGVALVRARQILDDDDFSHGPEGASYFVPILDRSNYADYLAAGENLAIQYDSHEEIIDAWMKSPTHRDNILLAGYEDTGVSVVEGEFEGNFILAVVQLFGAKK